MKKVRIVAIVSAAVILVAAAGIFILNRPGELTIVFPEMSSAQKGFIDPLVTLYESETGTDVTYYKVKSTEFYSNACREEPTGDLYYTVNNYQLRRLAENGGAVEHGIRKAENIPDLFLSDPYFLPVSWYPWGVYYNREAFRELGLDEPETWDEFLEICAASKSAGYRSVSLMTKLKWPSVLWFDYLDIMYNGADFHNRVLSGEVAFTDEALVRVFEELFKLHSEGYVYMESDSHDWQSMIDAVADEKALMHLSGSFFCGSLSDEQKAEIGWFPFPEVDTLVASSSGFFLPKNSENRRQAKKFLRFVLEQTSQQVIQNNSDLIAVNADVSAERGQIDIDAVSPVLPDYESIISSYERNTHPEIAIRLKSAVNAIYSIQGKSELNGMIGRLEEYRQSLRQ